MMTETRRDGLPASQPPVPPYTADKAREESIGQGDYRETENPNRSYKGKTGVCYNERDLDNVLEMREKMGNKPGHRPADHRQYDGAEGV